MRSKTPNRLLNKVTVHLGKSGSFSMNVITIIVIAAIPAATPTKRSKFMKTDGSIPKGLHMVVTLSREVSQRKLCTSKRNMTQIAHALEAIANPVDSTELFLLSDFRSRVRFRAILPPRGVLGCRLISLMKQSLPAR